MIFCGARGKICTKVQLPAWTGGEGGVLAGNAVLIPAASNSIGFGAIQFANYLVAIPVVLTRTSALRQ
jgi:NADPH:quinone reductase-like Zn-dependent oxidoreductase